MPRIGVLNVEEKALGFIFIDTTSLLSLLRHAIDDQVRYQFHLTSNTCLGSEILYGNSRDKIVRYILLLLLDRRHITVMCFLLVMFSSFLCGPH